MDADTIVRKYLTYLDDPSVLRDDAAIADARRRADTATDPVERLRLLSQVERMERPDPAAFEAEVSGVLKAWADAEGITEGALAAFGVPPRMLAAAYGRRRRNATKPKAGRGPGVGVEDVRAAVPSGGTFTMRSLREASQASPGTVRKALREMLADGTIVDRGPDAAWEGPGRVPTLYERP